MSYNRRLTLAEMETHLEAAAKWGAAAKMASLLSHDAGVLAQIQFEEAILAARKTELRAKRGASAEDVRQMKDEATVIISRTLQQLQKSNIQRFEANQPRATFWKNRLRAP